MICGICQKHFEKGGPTCGSQACLKRSAQVRADLKAFMGSLKHEEPSQPEERITRTMMTKQEFANEFMAIYVAEHGPGAREDEEQLTELLDRAWIREGTITLNDMEEIVMGGEDGEPREDLTNQYPLLNCIALWGILYDEDEAREEFERLWSIGAVH